MYYETRIVEKAKLSNFKTGYVPILTHRRIVRGYFYDSYGWVVFMTLTTGYFHDKTKIFKTDLRVVGVDYYFLLKYCTRQSNLLPPRLGQITLQNLIPK